MHDSFIAAKDRIAAVWTSGMGEWFRAKAPSDQISMLMVTDMVDAAWKSARQNPSLLPQFDGALALWEQTHFQAILNYGRNNL